MKHRWFDSKLFQTCSSNILKFQTMIHLQSTTLQPEGVQENFYENLKILCLPCFLISSHHINLWFSCRTKLAWFADKQLCFSQLMNIKFYFKIRKCLNFNLWNLEADSNRKFWCLPRCYQKSTWLLSRLTFKH
jgi:hypothetical protein